jgi:hypothetical protein
MQAWTETRPTTPDVQWSEKSAHVDADFRHDDAREGLADGGNGQRAVAVCSRASGNVQLIVQ